MKSLTYEIFHYFQMKRFIVPLGKILKIYIFKKFACVFLLSIIRDTLGFCGSFRRIWSIYSRWKKHTKTKFGADVVILWPKIR